MSIRSYKCINFARKSKVQKKGKKKREDFRRGTVVNMSKQNSESSLDYYRRKYTIDFQKFNNPILKSRENIGCSMDGFSKSGVSLKNDQGTLSSRGKNQSSGKIKECTHKSLLKISNIPVARHERTNSFMNKLPNVVRNTINFDRTQENLVAKDNNFIKILKEK